MKLKCLRLCLFALFVFQASAIIGQARKVNGRVLSDDSGPLAGVSVTIKGKQGGVQTNASGEYNIEVSEGDVLLYSFSGFKSREYKVTAGAIPDITLETKVSELDAVVVTGYGTQKRKRSDRCRIHRESQNI